MYDLAEDIQIFTSNPEMQWRNRPVLFKKKKNYIKALVKQSLPNNLVTQPRTA